MSRLRAPLAGGVFLFACAARAQAVAPARVELPVRPVVLGDGALRYAVPVQVGGTRIDAGLDTGSAGLRILPGTLAASDAEASARPDSIRYGSGAELDGVLGRAAVRFGDGPAASIDVELIRRVGCTARKPDCPAGRVAPADYGIQGDGLPGQGFKAILGINTAPSGAPNPLVAAGVRRWVLVLPRPGEPGPGRLILNPTPEETADFVRLARDAQTRDVRAGMHDAVPGCLTDTETHERVCGPLLMDCGAPGVDVARPDGVGPAWRNGTPVQLSLLRDGRPAVSADFVVGRRDQASRLTFSRRADLPGPRIFAGVLPYLAYEVLYDTETGEVGVRPRPGFGAPHP